MEKRKTGRKVALLVGVAVAAVLFVIVAFYGREIRAWYALLVQFERLPDNGQGYPEYRHRQIGIVFVRVPSGEFWMGTSEEEADELTKRYAEDLRERGFSPPFERRVATETPRHSVALSAFLIAKHEVTQSQWESVMGRNPSEFEGERVPVNEVSWEECQEFCEKTGLRLPTEAQWEYACRAGTTETEIDDLQEREWYVGNSGRRPHPVGEKKPNDFGLYDMGGNVFEWCEDVFDPNFYSSPLATVIDPVCEFGSEYRVYRGGCCNYGSWSCRPGNRGYGEPTSGGGYIGFRVVYPLP